MEKKILSENVSRQFGTLARFSYLYSVLCSGLVVCSLMSLFLMASEMHYNGCTWLYLNGFKCLNLKVDWDWDRMGWKSLLGGHNYTFFKPKASIATASALHFLVFFFTKLSLSIAE